MKNPAIEARRLLDFLGMYKSPVSIQDICDYLNIELVFSVSNQIEALFVRSRYGDYISVSDNRPPARIRFSIAHEVGHHVLGHGAISFLQEIKGVRPRRQEIYANQFAGELLMPKILVCRMGGPTARQVAAEFGVSVQAAGIRLKELGMTG